ncbi:hypothetical protein B0H13DRAFT_2471502 [Mycena leptocephala]|nr:hypothetical protein B0H13DRAFT_2471502 [Mycena leptocephala]
MELQSCSNADQAILQLSVKRKRKEKSGKQADAGNEGSQPHSPHARLARATAALFHVHDDDGDVYQAFISGFDKCVLLGHHVTPGDAYLAYLPLAHTLEYIVELIMLAVGMPTGFGGQGAGQKEARMRVRELHDGVGRTGTSGARRVHWLGQGVGVGSCERKPAWPWSWERDGRVVEARRAVAEPTFLACAQAPRAAATLTDASVRNCDGDVKAFRPSIMVGVPAVWETIRKGIVRKVAGGGRVRESVFRGAVEAKRRGTSVLSKLADSVILSSVREATGGRLRIAMSGGGDQPRDAGVFERRAGDAVAGITESCGMCAIMPPECIRYDTVGLPVGSIEIKFRDVPEAGYFSCGRNGATEERGEGRRGAVEAPGEGGKGERLGVGDLPRAWVPVQRWGLSLPNRPLSAGATVCIRGPSAISGYFKRPDLNSDPTIFAGDGWLRTGDVVV